MASNECGVDQNSYINNISTVKIENECINLVDVSATATVDIRKDELQTILQLGEISSQNNVNGQHSSNSIQDNENQESSNPKDVEASNRAWFEKTFGSLYSFENDSNDIEVTYDNVGTNNVTTNEFPQYDTNIIPNQTTYNIPNSSFKCTECDYTTDFLGHYRRHMLCHTETFDYVCPECGYICDKQFKLKKHMLKHSAEKPFMCEICPFRGGTKDSLAKHTLSHTGELPFACTMCDYRCYIKGILEKHMLRHSGEKPFECSMCDYKCTGNGNLKRHMMTHTGEKPFACSECPHKCSDKDSLKIHMMRHSGETAFSCTECDYQCRVKSALHRHMLKHTGEKPFVCTQCDYKCVQITQLKMHMLNHTGDKPFACSSCDYKCTSKGSLNSHMVTHTGERKFSCVLCGLKFSANSTLKTHLLKHSGQKPYACTLCDYRCTSRSNLKKHIMIHTGDKPYQCNKCNYKCSDKSSLNGHMKKHLKHIPFEQNTQKSLWPCVDCGVIYEKKSKLIEHMSGSSGQNCKFKTGNIDQEVNMSEEESSASNEMETQNGIEHNVLTKHSKPQKSLWPCVQCGELFQKKSRLLEHMSSQKCKKRDGSFKRQQELIEREQSAIISEERSTYNGIKIINGKEFDFSVSHSNTPKSLWPCVKCGELFHKKARLLEHMSSQTCKKINGNIKIQDEIVKRTQESNMSEGESTSSNKNDFQNGTEHDIEIIQIPS